MKNFQIHSSIKSRVLYEGRFHSFKSCLEQAVRDGVKLTRANLARKNLSNVTLDNARLEGADFKGCNLTGANLSEAKLSGASFQDADLYNACLACSDVNNCDFRGAGFGATDITACDISGARFSTLSCFSLDFTSARAMKECRFIDPDGAILEFSNPHVVVNGLTDKIIVYNNQWLKIGQTITLNENAYDSLMKTSLKSLVSQT